MNFKKETKLLVKGLIRTAAGAAVTGLCGLAALGIYRLTNDSGWNLVFDLVSTGTLLLASLEGIYFLGGGRNGK